MSISTSKSRKNSNGQLPRNAQVQVIPRNRIFSASIGFLLPTIVDAVVNGVNFDDFNSLEFFFEERDFNTVELTESELIHFGFKIPLLSHEHADDTLTIGINNSDSETSVREFDFQGIRRTPNTPLNTGFLFNENLNADSPFLQNLNEAPQGPEPTIDKDAITLANDVENNSPPVAIDDAVTTPEDTPVDISLLNNDTDPNGDNLTVVPNSLTQPSNGSVTLNNDGSATYTPNLNFNGTDSFEYTISDGRGGFSIATAEVTISGTQDPPVALNDNVTGTEDQSINIDAIGNDSDPDGDTVSVIGTSISNPNNGSASLNPDGTITYTPDQNFNGTDSFTYTIDDGNGNTDTATIFVDISAVNDLPVAQDDSYITDEDVPLNINAGSGVLSNDSDVEGPLAVTGIGTNPTNGSLTLNNDGSFTYTPDTNFFGTDSFTYTVVDTDGATDIATVNLTVNPVDDPVDAINDTDSTNEDTPVTTSVLNNDNDFGDGDTLSITGTTDPSNGSILVNLDNTITYTPDSNFFGTDSYTYTISDGNGNTDTATVTITVNSVNDLPAVQDDSYSTNEDVTLNVPAGSGVLSNDTDVEGPLTVTGVGNNPTNGSLILNNDGSFSYTPDPNFFGTDSFTYTVVDTNGATDIATVNLTINPVNDLPVVQDDSYSTDEDVPLNINAGSGVLSNDSDVEGPLTVTGVGTNPTNGSLTLNNDGSFTYTPAPNFFGTDSFTYTVVDTDGATDIATVNLTINPIDDPVDALNDTDSTNEDTPVTTSVLNNDNDFDDGDTLSIIGTTDPSNGSIVVNPDNTITYTPDSNFTGTDSYTYTISDGNGNTDTATVTISVGAVNDLPVVQDDSYTTDEDVPLNINAGSGVLSNDSDVEGPLTVTGVGTNPTNGSLTLNSDGSFIYTPDPNFFGTDSFTYTVVDTDGATDIATVNLTINPIDDPVDAINDTDSTNEDTPVTTSVLNNDNDFGDGDTLSIIGTTDPSNGSIIVNPDNTITYTPDSNFFGTDSYTYTISDGNGNTDTATVTITVNAIDDPVDAINDTDTTNEDTPVTTNVLNNDNDFGDGDTLSIVGTTDPSNGSIIVNPDNTITYTPDSNFFGTDSYTYTISDGNGNTDTATVTITVNSVNDLPIVQDDSYSTDEDTPLNINAGLGVLSNDSDVEGPLTVTGVGTSPSNGSLTLNNDGSFTYNPDPNFFGTDSFTYTVVDTDGATDIATVNLTVNPVNDLPVVQDDSYTTDEDVPLNVPAGSGVLSNDSDVEGPLTVTGVGTNPTNGSLTLNNDGSFTYNPDPNFFGTDSFTYTVIDTDGATDIATVNLTVNPIDDPVDAVNDTDTTNEDNPVTTSVLSNDNDFGDGDVISITGTTDPSNGSILVNPDNTITYTPDSNFFGTDSYTYTITDGNGNTDTATVTITVNAVNDLPVVQDDSYSTNEDTTLNVPAGSGVLSNDSDVEGPLTVTGLGTNPSNGSLTLNPDGSFTYTPDPNFFGTDSFTYTVIDTDGATDIATVNLTVNPVDDPVDAVKDSDTTNEDNPVTTSVLNNDNDFGDGDVISITGTTDPSNGSIVVNPDNTITYTPDKDFFGTDSYTYTITDGNGNFDTATVNITVNSVNDLPVAVDDDFGTILEDTSTTQNVIDGSAGGLDTDPVEGSSLSVISVTQGSNGSVTFKANGDITYTPDLHYNGTDSFTYTVSDVNGGTDSATVIIDMTPVDDPPFPSPDTINTDEDNSVDFTTANLLSNDLEVDGENLTFVSFDGSSISNGTLNLVGNKFTYTPDANFFGTENFTYTVQDDTGNLVTESVTINIKSVNDLPVAVDDDFGTILEDTSTTQNVINGSAGGLDTDPVEGSPLSVISVTQGSNGTVTFKANGDITYTPDLHYNGTDSFTYVISDTDGGTDSATVIIDMTPVDDAPFPSPDTIDTDEDNSVNFTTADLLSNDLEVDGENLTFVSFDGSSISNGILNLVGSTFTYTPDANFFGTENFTYTVQDDTGNQVTESVTININPINDPPVAADDTATTDEDTAIDINVIDGSAGGLDTDPIEGDSLSVQSVTQGANGTVSINGDGTVKYNPDLNFNGTDSFTYIVSDGNGGTDTATVLVTINPVNDNPVAVDDSTTTDEDTPVTINVLDGSAGGLDTDPVEGDSITVTSVTQGQNGTVSFLANGDVTYTPDQDFNGTDSYTYTITDANGGTDTATVIVTINPVNDDPVAVDDGVSTLEDTAVTFTVLPNDSDVDLDITTVSSFTNPTNGNLNFNSGNQRFTYTPDLNFTGTDSFTYVLNDGNGGTASATVTFTVDPINDAPVAGDDTVSVDEDNTIDISALLNDNDVDLDSITVTAATQGTNGSVSINPDNTIKYTPDQDFNGVDEFTYTITDGNGTFDTAKITVTVNPINDAPVAGNDTATTFEDVGINISPLGNDTDVDLDTLSISSVGSSSNATISINAGSKSISYIPDPDFNGTDSFTYVVTDSNGGTDTGTITVTVIPINDDPVASNDSGTLDEDTSITIDVLGNDNDVDLDTLNVISSSGNTTINPDNTITFTPNANFNGNTSFTYTISDGNGGQDTATVNLIVNPVEDDPDARDDEYLANEDTPITLNILSNDGDVDGDTVTIQSVTQPSTGSVLINPDNTVTFTPGASFDGIETFSYTITDGNGNTDSATVTLIVDQQTFDGDDPTGGEDFATTPEDTLININVLANDNDPQTDSLTIIETSGGQGNITVKGDGTIDYDPPANFNGVDSFFYTVSDGNGNTDTIKVTVTVTPVQDDPNANNDGVTTQEDNAVTISVLSNDGDVDGDTVSVVSAINGSNGTTVVNGNGTITYTPDANYNGTDSFTYVITDGNGNTDSATVNINITAEQDNPDGGDDFASVDEDNSVTFSILDNDNDVDGDQILIAGVGTPSNGTISVNPDNTVTYTPDENFNGTDSFTYLITDTKGNTGSATATITINPVNDVPEPLNNIVETNEDTAVNINVVLNDEDIELDELTVTSTTQGANGSVSIELDNTLTYTPNANFNGTDSFIYKVSDGNGGTASATVNVTVISINDNPVTVDDTATTDEENNVIVNVLNNDSDVDLDTLTVTNIGTPTNGNVSLNADKTITYIPDENFAGTDSFTYEIADGKGGTATGTVTVTVNNIDDPITAVDDSTVTDEDNSVIINVLSNEIDVDNDSLTVSSVTQAANGSVVINPDQTVTYNPNADFNGTDSFTYVVDDGNGNTDTATVNVTINPINDDPDAVDDSYSVDEDQTLNINAANGVLDNDSDVELQSLAVTTVIDQPDNGNVVINTDGSFTYTPDSNFFGVDTFEYEVSDGNGGAATATVSITINPLGDPPNAVDDSTTATQNTPIVVNVLDGSAGGLDIDPDGDSLDVVSVTQGDNGGTVILNFDDTITYTSTAVFTGNETFTYTITDGNGNFDTGTVVIFVS